MINVSDETKLIYQQDSIPKELRIVFPNLGLEYHTEDLILESFEWTESVFDGENIEFVGCIASKVKFDIVDRTGAIASVNNEFIRVYLTAGDTEEIPIFYGYVQSAVRTAQQYVKTITAYDRFQQLQDVDVTTWYTTHNQCTINELLTDLLAELNIERNVDQLINGELIAFCKNSKRDITNLSALNLLKAICQINGCCGRIDRYGRFAVVYLDTTMFNVPYPSYQLFPMDTIYPHEDPLLPAEVSLMSLDEDEEALESSTPAEAVAVSYYKSVNYEDYNVQSISKVTIRDRNDDSGVSVGDGDNNYIIQGNMFAFDQSTTALREAADLILMYNQKFEYTPFESDNNGLPFLECGDGVTYYDIDYEPTINARSIYDYREPEQVERKFCILSRTVSGIQNLRDNFSAEGEKNQKTMVSDLGLQVTDIDNQITEISQSITEIETGMLKAVSVTRVPTHWDANTIYFIRK